MLCVCVAASEMFLQGCRAFKVVAVMPKTSIKAKLLISVYVFTDFRT